MLVAIIFAAGLLLYVLIRRHLRKTGQFQVIDQTGYFYYFGSFTECRKVAKLKNIEAEAYDEDDRFTVKRYKAEKLNVEAFYLQ